MTTVTQKKIGIVLIWMGVLAWVPYIYLISNGKESSIWPYLIVHLAGSFGGGKLQGRTEQDKLLVGTRRRKISKVLIYIGVIAWLPYIYLDNIVGIDVDITPYLTAHLLGIFSGIFVRLSVVISEKWQHEKVKICSS